MVGAVPVVARQFGPAVGAVVLTVPIVMVTSLLAVGQGEGRAAAEGVALRAIPALLSLAAYLGAAWVGYRLGLPLAVAAVAALLAWAAVSIVVVALGA